VQRVDQLIAYAQSINSSDIHIKTDLPSFLRRPGGLEPLQDAAWSEDEVLGIVRGMLSQENWDHFLSDGEADGSYGTPDGGRVRVNCYRERGKPGLALRIIPSPPTLEQLGMREQLAPYLKHKDGLIIVTGPTGSGKSSTLAGIISSLANERHDHIVTIEDPVEYIYKERGVSIITQREVGTDTRTFAQALRRVLRQDPDVIVIGESRDAETMSAALSAAETGHLVFTTLHAVNVKETISRVLEMFPAEQHNHIRHLLAGVLRGVIAQRLLPTTDGKRVALQELMVGTNRVAEAIADPEKTGELDEIMYNGELHGMQTFNQALLKLVVAERITPEIALANSQAKQNLRLLLQNAFGRDPLASAPGSNGAPTFGVE
jgi:twitching motility protein PilT